MSSPQPPTLAPTSDAARWQRVKNLLADALERPATERHAFIADASGGDAALRAELDALVAAAAQTHSLLDAPPRTAARDALQADAARGADAWIGQRLDSWRITALIADGGMGRVFQAERADGLYEQQVALKLMGAGLDRDGLVARFVAERQILAGLDHPNLAKVIDGGITADGMPYFVMELVRGEPLDRYCSARLLDIEARVRLFRTVCQVVHYTHQRGVVHRDLKPANILVTHDGTVKLVDFGIAKRFGDERHAAPPTATAQRVMTLDYASPEQVRGEAVTPASDIYSLGVVLYRLLTRASPYPDAALTSDYQLSRAICDTEPLPPSRVGTAPTAPNRAERRRLHGDLDAIVLMALRKDASRRYGSAEAMADDLFRFLEHLPVQARHGAWNYRAGRFVLRHRAMLGAALVANLAMVVGLTIAVAQSYEASRQQARAERHFASVRRLATVLLSDVHRAIETLPGATEARRLIVTSALGYLEPLAAEAHGDPQLQLELARGYRTIGDIQGNPMASNLGDPKGAQASWDRAEALAEAVLAAPAAPPATLHAARRERALTRRVKAAMQAMDGRFDSALATARAGIADSEVLIAHPLVAADVDADLRLRAGLYSTLAQSIALSPRTDGFQEASDTAIRLLKELLAKHPDDPSLGGSLASMHGMRSMFVRSHDDTPHGWAQSRRELDQAVTLLQRLTSLHPDHVMLAANLAVAYAHRGNTLQQLGEVKAGIADRRRAVEVLAPRVRQDPDNAMLRVDYASFLGELGEALLAVGDLDGAVSAAQTAVTVFDEVPEGARSNMVSQWDHGQTLHRLGKALARRARGDDMARACQAEQRGLAMLRDHEQHFASHPPADSGDEDPMAQMATFLRDRCPSTAG